MVGGWGGDISYHGQLILRMVCVAEAYVCVHITLNCRDTVRCAASHPLIVRLSPRMELPPLSPGIHDNVIDVVVVFVTVRRGWSGGTEDRTEVYCSVRIKLTHVSL